MTKLITLEQWAAEREPIHEWAQEDPPFISLKSMRTWTNMNRRFPTLLAATMSALHFHARHDA